MVMHSTNEEALQAAKALVEQVALATKDIKASSRWMVAAWDVSGGEIKLVGRTTFQFPTGDFLAAIGQLAMSCFEETKLSLQGNKEPGPLPWAKIGFPRPHLATEERVGEPNDAVEPDDAVSECDNEEDPFE